MTSLRQSAAALRAEVVSALPEKAYLRIDRTGNALYAVSGDTTSLRERGWQCEPRGPVTLLSPGLPQLQALRASAPAHPAAAAFAARPADPTILPLLAACLRALEMPPVPAARAKLDKQLRQAMAVALRTGTGGGLEVCHALFFLLDIQ